MVRVGVRVRDSYLQLLKTLQIEIPLKHLIRVRVMVRVRVRVRVRGIGG